MGGRLSSVSHFLGKHHHIFPVAVHNGMHDGDTVGQAAVQVKLIPDLYISGNQRKGCGGPHCYDIPVHFLQPEIFGLSCFYIGNYRIGFSFVSVKGFIIIGIQPVGNIVIAHFYPEQIPRCQYIICTAVMFIIQIIHTDCISPASLT